MNLKDAFESPLLQEALAIASKDLFDVSTKNDLDGTTKSSNQICLSFIKYFIRLSTRSTPFGLFSGFSIGQFGDVTNITVSVSHQHIKRARPDMEWVYGFIKKIEANKKIRNLLNVRFNDFTYKNGNRIEKPNKTFLQLEKSNEILNELSTSIRYTHQVEILEEKCVDFNMFSSLIDDIITQNPNVPINKAETFLSQLLENEFLLSELRLPLINTDILGYLLHILNKIKGIEEVDLYVSKLKEIQKNISDYNQTSVGNGLGLYNNIIKLQEELYECKNYLQVDMKIHTENNNLDYTLKEDLEQFVSAMHKLSIPEKKSDEMTHYIELFLERYGHSAEIPVLELLDVDRGLGSPAHFHVNTINRKIPKRQKTAKEERLKTLLDRKMILALREGKNTIKITDDDIDYICLNETQTDEVSPMDVLQSFELYLFAHPRDDYNFTIAPAMASDGYGKSFGRFSDMFTIEETLLFEEGFNGQKKLLPEYIIAEITELPSTGRSSNLSLVNSNYDYQIALTTNPCKNKHVLSIRDLYIGVESQNNQFYIISKSLGKRVIVTMTCMLNPMFGSGVLRFLREISAMRRMNVISGIMNIVNTHFEYSPRIVYNKIIIKPETWVVTKDIFGNERDKKILEEKFISFRQTWDVPKFVFLNEYDNRLLLDLDNQSHRNIIVNTLQKTSMMSISLTELSYDFSDCVAKNLNGESYITEIVVPFVLGTNNKIKSEKTNKKDSDIFTTYSDVSANRIETEREQCMLLPGNNKWLYYKLYGCSKRQNELISVAYEILEKFVIEGLAEKYFFIRYADPEPHLRLRIQPTQKGLSSLFIYTNNWINSLYIDGLISKSVNDSYIRESERYGGSNLIEYAEDYFYSNSKLVMSLLTLQRYGEIRFNVDFIGVSFIVSTLEAFGLSINEQKTLLDSLSHNKSNRKEFQNNRKMIVYAVDSSDNWFSIRSSITNPEIYDLINDNTKTLEKYAKAIYATDHQGKLTNSIQEIVLSIIHMFCNRLVGNTAWEHKIYALARHGVHGLKGLLENHQKEFVTLELPESLI